MTSTVAVNRPASRVTRSRMTRATLSASKPCRTRAAIRRRRAAGSLNVTRPRSRVSSARCSSARSSSAPNTSSTAARATSRAMPSACISRTTRSRPCRFTPARVLANARATRASSSAPDAVSRTIAASMGAATSPCGPAARAAAAPTARGGRAPARRPPKRPRACPRRDRSVPAAHRESLDSRSPDARVVLPTPGEAPRRSTASGMPRRASTSC